jgi:hypothetical protein
MKQLAASVARGRRWFMCAILSDKALLFEGWSI